ncbi:MAG: nucleotidyltransferase [Verrucomicrobiales bacterium]
MTEPSFEKLLVRLAEAGIQFIVVGGVAVTLQGYVRLTDDVDLLLENSPDNIRLFIHSLTDYGEGFARDLTVDDFTDEEGAIRIVEEVESCQIDAFTVMAGLHYGDIIADADFFIIGDQRIAVASKAALIRWKAPSLRDKDRLDAMALRELLENPRAFD